MASKAYEIATALAEKFRLIGTEGEVWARGYCADQFKAIGIEPELEEFRATTFGVDTLARVIMLPPCMLLLASYYFLAKAGMPVAAVISSALIFVFGKIALSKFDAGFTGFENLGTSADTANVVGRIKPTGEIKAKAVLMAHYDTKSQTYSILVRILLYVISTFGILIFGPLYIIGGVLAFFKIGFLGPDVYLYGTLITTIAGFLVVFNGLGNESPGALDNAASVGVIISAAERLKQDPPKNVEVIVVASGAEEVGLTGAANFVKAHENDLDKASTYIINLDGVGSKGKFVALKSYGIPPRYTSEKLNKLIEEICSEKSIPVKFHYFPIGGSTDMYPFVKAGYESVNLSSLSGNARYVHTPKDTIDYIDEQGLEWGVTVTEGLVRKLDTN